MTTRNSTICGIFRSIAFSILLLAACSLRLAAQPYWQQQVNYTIDVSLNDPEKSLDGFLKMQYRNNSPDTLTFIWFHLWPNAFKNDRTAFSEQMLGNGKTDFYFSDKGQKGYINRLDFRVDGMEAKMEDHPRYIDIIRVLLPHPLPPGGEITITTPFHEQLPFNFSRGGHRHGSFQLTQWYPKPAVYDRKGWHPIPYLDQGEFYSEFGNFDVRITVPAAYVVAATGALQDSTTSTVTSASTTPPAALLTPTTTRTPPSAAALTSTSAAPPTPTPSSPRALKSVPATTTARTSSSRRTSPHTPNLRSQNSKISKPHPLPSPDQTRTFHYRQDNVHDFAWFANPHYRVDHDTLQLPSGRIIAVYAYYPPEDAAVWKNSVQYIKEATRFRSSLVGEYPYRTVSAAEIEMGSPGGMEYPTITGITRQSTGKALDLVIEHEVGHNWFYGILGTDERRYPWMDEGINTYYDKRYEALKYGPTLPSRITVGLAPNPKPNPAPNPKPSPTRSPNLVSAPNPNPTSNSQPSIQNLKFKIQNKSSNAKISPPPSWLLKKMPEDVDRLLIGTLAKERLDQPISTSSGDFTPMNYDLIAYSKTAFWMQALEDSLGTPLFDSCMREYFRRWQYRHPYPEDFRTVITMTSGRPLDTLFAELDEKGPLSSLPVHRVVRPTFLFNARNTDKINYINILPAIGYNKYDQFMVGALIHNYNLPPGNFRFLLAPLYATNSRQWNGLGRVGYTWYPDTRFQKVELSLAGARFSTLSGADSNGKKIFGGFYKLVPAIRFTFPNASARSTLQKWIEWKTFLIGENNLGNYILKTSDSNYYPTAGKYAFRYLDQLSFSIEDSRVLYPYKALLQVQQAAQFYRVNFTGNYFFNYGRDGGMNVRLFAAKFGLLGNNSTATNLSLFEPKLTAVRGNEDYTYSNYFAGRNEYAGFTSQQIMMRDGDLKLRTDLFQGLQGRSANWVASANFNSTLPPALVPSWMPLKVFLDVGTYAEAWQNDPPTSRFLYVGGLQLSLLKNMLNFYAPLFYSSDFRNQLKTVPGGNGFWQKISFSIDIQNFSLHKILPNIPL